MYEVTISLIGIVEGLRKQSNVFQVGAEQE